MDTEQQTQGQAAGREQCRWVSHSCDTGEVLAAPREEAGFCSKNERKLLLGSKQERDIAQ